MGEFGCGDVQAFVLADGGAFPNNPTLPLLVYPGAFLPFAEGADPASLIGARFAENGWPRAWRNGVYPFQHYHATAHEVLGVSRGSARVQFGGPDGRTINLQAGDAVLLPAGTAHCRIAASGDFEVVGAYPPGQDPDMGYGKAGERPAADEEIGRVELPGSDPLLGTRGGVAKLWG
jgi:uncharacterized protein YjlB